jgi:hypothetical protein
MKVLYIDEAGGVEAPNSSAAATPLMVIAGVAFDEAVIRNTRRHAIGFLDKVVELMGSHGARIVGRIWVKDAAMNPRSSYTFAIQDIASHFEHLLTSSNAAGLMICDGRLHHQDAEVSHSIFTQKHKLGGDSFPHLVEATVFGRS